MNIYCIKCKNKTNTLNIERNKDIKNKIAKRSHEENTAYCRLEQTDIKHKSLQRLL